MGWMGSVVTLSVWCLQVMTKGTHGDADTCGWKPGVWRCGWVKTLLRGMYIKERSSRSVSGRPSACFAKFIICLRLFLCRKVRVKSL